MVIEYVFDHVVGIIALTGVLAVIALLLKNREIRPKEPSPAYVARIFRSRVEIERDSEQLKSFLESSPFSDNMIMDPPGYLVVRFRDEGPQLENKDLHELLNWLNSQGLPFSIGKGWGPSEVMAELRSRGYINTPYKTIYWTGPGDWHISDVYPDPA